MAIETEVKLPIADLELFRANLGRLNPVRISERHFEDNYVLDNIAIDPNNTKIIYVAAWGVGNVGGDFFRSKDGGKSWETIDALHGKSLRALALANRRFVVCGEYFTVSVQRMAARRRGLIRDRLMRQALCSMCPARCARSHPSRTGTRRREWIHDPISS